MLKIFFENSKFRNYLFLSCFSRIGGGIFAMFMMWVIHFQYQNTFYTGLAGAMFALIAITNFLIGPFVDRHHKISIIRWACFVQFCVVGAVLFFSVNQQPSVWLLMPMIFLFSAAGLIKNPAFTALLPKIVTSDDLIKANAFINISTTIAGLCIGLFLYFALQNFADFSLVYMTNAAVLFVALVISMFIKNSETFEQANPAYFAELKQGLTFVRHGVLAFLVVTLLVWDFSASAAYVNLPMFAEIHTGEASGYIVLAALAMVGGVVGAYISRILAPKLEIWKILGGTLIAAGITRIIFVNLISENFSNAIYMYIFYTGLAAAASLVITTLLQKLPPKGMIARISTITTSLLGVTSVLGSLLGGVLGTLLANVDYIFIIQGASYIVIGVFVCVPKSIRLLPKITEV
ncbi:MAG: MFS transporter [Turicibacter sp.]|nr:MFS transporter [Turicibacter sp.]